MAEVERTLVVLKPDAVARGLAGRIIQRFEDTGMIAGKSDERVVTKDAAAAAAPLTTRTD